MGTGSDGARCSCPPGGGWWWGGQQYQPAARPSTAPRQLQARNPPPLIFYGTIQGQRAQRQRTYLWLLHYTKDDPGQPMRPIWVFNRLSPTHRSNTRILCLTQQPQCAQLTILCSVLDPAGSSQTKWHLFYAKLASFCIKLDAYCLSRPKSNYVIQGWIDLALSLLCFCIARIG